MVSATEFVVVLIVLYLLECFRMVRPDELVFDRTVLSRHWIRKPILYPTNGKWGWIILNPLRPDGPVFSIVPPCYAVTSVGVLALSEGPDQFKLYSFDSCCDSRVDADSKVRFKSGCIQARSQEDANELVRTIRYLAEVRPERRVKRLKKL